MELLCSAFFISACVAFGVVSRRFVSIELCSPAANALFGNGVKVKFFLTRRYGARMVCEYGVWIRYANICFAWTAPTLDFRLFVCDALCLTRDVCYLL